MKTFSDVLECYEEIGKWLMEGVPAPWSHIVIEFEIIEIDDVSEYWIEYTPQRSPAKKKQFFINDTNFDDCFFQLAKLTSTAEKGFFRKCRFELDQDGSYNASFQYGSEEAEPE